MRERKRIAFISTLNRGPWGGSEELWSRTASRFLDDGHEVIAEVKRWPEPVRAVVELERKGAHIVWRPPATSYTQRLRHVVREVLPHWSCWSRPHFILISSAGDHLPLRTLRGVRGTGVPFGVLFHGVSEVTWPDDGEAEEYVTCLSAAQACFFVSQANLSLMNVKLGFRLANAHVVWNPFNVRYTSSPPWPRDTGECRMAVVARLDPGAKGQDVLFDMLSLDKWRRRALQINLYGSGRCEGVLKRQREALELSRVTFRGRIEEVEKIWEENHMLLLPSREEGMPLALVEAMLCGRPAIVTRVAGMPELVTEGATGFLAEAPTVRCLDACMERAWQRRAQWERMGALCASTIREVVPADPAGEFKEHILDLIGKPAGSPIQPARAESGAPAPGARVPGGAPPVS